MEGSGNGSKREGKRKLDESDDGGYDRGSASKQQKTPFFSRVVLEALKRDGLQKFFSYFEPFLRKIFREEMQQYLLQNDDPSKLGPSIQKIVHEELERALKPHIPDKLAGRSSPPRIKASSGRELCLRVVTKMPHHLFAGQKVKGEGGAAICVILIDLSDGNIVRTEPESSAKLNVLVLHGDFDAYFNNGWTHEIFKSHQVKERDGKASILSGDLHVKLKDGMGILGDLKFTDNSSWTRTRKFILGVEVAPGFCEGINVHEAKTEAFSVLDQRGECNRKHYPPSLQDEVYRLEGIAKVKSLHKILIKAGIITVEDLLRYHAKDPQNLRNMVKDKTTDNKWKKTIEHAKTCDLSCGKFYVFFTDESRSFGVIFNHIHEPEGCIDNGKVLSLGSVPQTNKTTYFVKKAYENWHEVIEYDDHLRQSFTAIEETEACHKEQFGSLLVNTDETCIEGPFINPETGFHGNSIFCTGETSTAGFSDSLNDCSQPNNGHELEQIFCKPVPIMDDEMEKIVSMFETGETSKDGCSYSLENWLDNTECDFGIKVGNDEAIISHYYDKDPEPNYDELFEVDPSEMENGMNGRTALVGWLKIKVVLKWGEVMRKKAAERRAQLTELD